MADDARAPAAHAAVARRKGSHIRCITFCQRVIILPAPKSQALNGTAPRPATILHNSKCRAGKETGGRRRRMRRSPDERDRPYASIICQRRSLKTSTAQRRVRRSPELQATLRTLSRNAGAGMRACRQQGGRSLRGVKMAHIRVRGRRPANIIENPT
jgi:hypothetical protein